MDERKGYGLVIKIRGEGEKWEFKGDKNGVGVVK